METTKLFPPDSLVIVLRALIFLSSGKLSMTSRGWVMCCNYPSNGLIFWVVTKGSTGHRKADGGDTYPRHRSQRMPKLTLESDQK